MNPDLIFKKLRLFPHQQKLIVNAPAAFSALLANMPHDTQITPEIMGSYDFIAVFGSNKQELEQHLRFVAGAGTYDGLFWVCYPKGTGKIKSDLKREVIRTLVDQIALQCVTQIAIDETWSALRARPAAAVGK
ncbi:hypothetical protein [Adhaeribacter pallidiroseus]|uniref:DUF3052 domain-containing protein n=1 Tax=Adhaeribacter pallidiroseus TaxID=2072847 RepID=A0A369QNK5_9BACT|nr:hypothetical protein [Adhaeribacter pallidiroseus]RDC66471.1 hypothetical protein AHMF7616_05102 [Adhaeribacter pallidiroseus]